MARSIVVVENFYKDPMAKRAEALSFDYRRRGGKATYPGINSVETPDVGEATEKIASVLGKPIRWFNQTPTTPHSYYRLIMASDRALDHDIHADSPGAGPFPQWIGVCYLSLPEDCQGGRGGTVFWKHNRTGLERYPSFEEQARLTRMADIPNNPQEARKYLLQEGLDRSLWAEARRVPMAFNRAVFFQATLFHSHGESFGNTKENCRLIQAFIFQELDYFAQLVISSQHSKPKVFW